MESPHLHTPVSAPFRVTDESRRDGGRIQLHAIAELFGVSAGGIGIALGLQLHAPAGRAIRPFGKIAAGLSHVPTGIPVDVQPGHIMSRRCNSCALIVELASVEPAPLERDGLDPAPLEKRERIQHSREPADFDENAT